MSWFGWFITILFAIFIVIMLAVFAPQLGAVLLLLFFVLGGGLLFGGGIYDLFRKGDALAIWKIVAGTMFIFIGYMLLNTTIIGTLALQLF